MARRFLTWLTSLYDDYKFARRFTLHWAQLLITFVVISTMLQIEKIQHTSQGVVISAFVGILATSIGLYQWLRERDAQREIQPVVKADKPE